MDPRYYAFAQLWEPLRLRPEEHRPVGSLPRPHGEMRFRIGGMLVRLGSRMAGQPLILQGGHR